MRDGDDFLAIEIVDADGHVIGGGIAEPAEPDSTPRKPLPWKTIGAGALAIGVAIALIIALGSDDPIPEEVSEPWPILDGSVLQLSAAANDPGQVFGREWTFDLVVNGSFGVSVASLNSGEFSVLDLPDFASDVEVVGDQLFASGSEFWEFDNGRWRVRDDGTDDVWALLGNYLLKGEPLAAQPSFTHLITNETFTIDNVVTFLVVGDDIFTARGGRIGLVQPGGTEERWETGELLNGGQNGIIWRGCDALDDCAYWYGTADEPRTVRLDREAVETALLPSYLSPFGSRGVFGSSASVSASGRYAIDIDLDRRSNWTATIVDLQSGATVTLPDNTQTVEFTPDESAVIIGDGSTLIIVDTQTGDRHRLETGTSNPRSVSFIPADTIEIG